MNKLLAEQRHKNMAAIRGKNTRPKMLEEHAVIGKPYTEMEEEGGLLRAAEK